MRAINSDWLRAQLKSRDISMADLARHMGLHRSTILYKLDGKRHITVAEIESMAHYLSVPVADILRACGLKVGRMVDTPTPLIITHAVDKSAAVSPNKNSGDRYAPPIDCGADATALHGPSDPDCPWAGWIFVGSEPRHLDAMAIGRLAWCRTQDGDWLGAPHPSHHRQQWLATLLNGEQRLLTLLAAAPITLIQP